MASSVPSIDDFYARLRASPRVSVALPASIVAGGVRQSVHLLDLSAGGAKLSPPLPLATGSTLTLDCGTLCCQAIVCWVDGEAMGVRFEQELDQREVGALADRSTALAARMRAAG